MLRRMQIVLAGLWLLTLTAGCEPPPAPVATPGPPAPPPPAVAKPAPAAPTPPPIAKPAPPMLPPELIAKMDEALKLAKPPAAASADALDQAVVALEQQAKIGALAGEITAWLAKLTPDQQAEFMRRYQDQLTALQKAAVPVATPPANP
jgi:hypothetical protein